MDGKWTPRHQGDLGELSAMQWLVSIGAFVFTPLLHSPDYDLVADLDGRLIRIQVKTSTFVPKGRFEVRLSTSGGNQSWNGVVKRFAACRCDFLFVHVLDGRRWFIPSTAVGGETRILLGGPKYSEFEIEPGQALAARQRPLMRG